MSRQTVFGLLGAIRKRHVARKIVLLLAVVVPLGDPVHQIKYGKSYAPVLKNDKTAEAKVIVDKDLQIVGAEIYSAEAENVANMFAFIINKKITLEELDYMIYTFPSSSSVCLYKLHNIHYDL